MTDTPLLMVDLETSSLDERTGHLLEVGFAVVTGDLTEITARQSWVVHYEPTSLVSIGLTADETVLAMHTTNGLWDACRHADGRMFNRPDGTRLPSRLDAEICGWVAEHAGDPAIPLCGSSVAFDQRWLAAWLPAVVQGRTHRLVDPSGLRELLERWGQHGRDIVASRPPARKAHRVDPDIDDTLAELRHYQAALGLAPLTVAMDIAGIERQA